MSPYQKIVLGDRTYFPRGADRSPEYEAIFPNTAAGLSVLDLACNTGFYALRATYEGAKRVVAIDHNEKLLRHGEMIRKELGLAGEFIQGDMCIINLHETFDIVLCLNVLHYFPTIEIVDFLLARIEKWARWAIAFVILVPTTDADYLMTKDKRGRNRLAISTEHMARFFPDYSVEVSPSRMRPHDRKLVILSRKRVTIGRE